MMSQIYQLQSHTYQVVVYTWNSTSTNIKNEVKQFAKDIVLANADRIEQTIKEVAKTTVFSAIIIAISNKLVEELYPILLDVRSYSDQLRMTTQHIQELSESILDAKCDIHLLENNSFSLRRPDGSSPENPRTLCSADASLSVAKEFFADLNQKLEAISMQIDYLRTIQPSPFNEIMNSLSIFASPSMTDVFAKVTGTIGSSASQQGRTRIDNM
jgi:hypothetical protein